MNRISQFGRRPSLGRFLALAALFLVGLGVVGCVTGEGGWFAPKPKPSKTLDDFFDQKRPG